MSRRPTYPFGTLGVGEEFITPAVVQKVRNAYHNWKRYDVFGRGGVKFEFLVDGFGTRVRRVA